MTEPVLVINVGSVNTVFGLFTEGELSHTWRIETRPMRSADEYLIWLERVLKRENLDASYVQHTIVSCSHAEMLRSLQHAILRFFGHKALVMRAGLKTGIQIQTGRHDDFNADRIANMVAASSMGITPCLIIDLGSVTRIDILSAHKKHLGSVVTLGVQKSLDTLTGMGHAYPDAAIEKPERIIGKYASDAVQSGAYYGTLCMLEGLTEKILCEMKTLESKGRVPQIVVTGGYAKALSGHTKLFDHVVPSLTLKGLYLIATKNL